jgi:Flavin reductase like domain
MTVTAFASVSLDPLRVLFCAEKIARFHDAVLATGTWAVSVLTEDAEKTARWLATRGRPLAGQLDAFRHHPGAGPVRRSWTTRWPRWSAGLPPCTTAVTTASWSARCLPSPSRGRTPRRCCITPAGTVGWANPSPDLRAPSRTGGDAVT